MTTGKGHRWRWGVLCVALGVSTVRAIQMDFESYLTGELVGKPATGTKWGGTTKNYLIADGVGTGGGKCIEQASTAVSSQSVTFGPTAADLGVTSFDTSLTYECSFDVHLAASDGTSSSLIDFWIGRLSGASTCARISLRANGQIYNAYPSPGISLSGVLWSGGASAGWVNFRTKLDFQRRVFTLWLNGVKTWVEIPFNGTAHTTSFGTITLNTQSAYAASNTIRIDNLKIAVWREPPTVLTLR